MESNNSLKILLESVENKNDQVLNSDNTVDSKAGSLMGFEITLGIGYLSLVIGGLDGIKFWEGVIGLFLLAISTIFLLILCWPKKYIFIAGNLDDHKEDLSKSENDLLLQLISDAQNAFTENRKELKKKVELYKSATVLLIFSLFFLILSKVGGFYV